MSAYQYKVTVNHNRLIKSTRKSKIITQSTLSIKELQEIVGDNDFEICERQICGYEIFWSESRTETDDEMSNRILKDITYNKKVDAVRLGFMTLRDAMSGDNYIDIVNKSIDK